MKLRHHRRVNRILADARSAFAEGEHAGTGAYLHGRPCVPRPDAIGPEFNASSPWLLRWLAARKIRRYWFAIGFWMAYTSLANVVGEVETTAEQMIREAEDYANRGHS